MVMHPVPLTFSEMFDRDCESTSQKVTDLVVNLY